ncbi:MAG: hypothetical protein PHY99_06970, partial [Bacteroidales bacterium]|nr:hypothetical protein [Bacteroidales bacterium]
MRTRFMFAALILVGLPTALNAQVENRSPLKIKDFMVMNYEGQSPGQFQWSGDSKYLCFTWNPDGKPSDSVYRINPANPVLQKVPASEMQEIRPQGKQFNSDKSRELILKNGEVYLANIKTKDTVLAFSTSMSVSDVSFTHSGKKLVLTISNNLYLLDPVNGQFRQLTNFQAKKPETPERPSQQPPGQAKEKMNDQDQWLMQDQMRLFPKVAGAGRSGRRGGIPYYGMGRRPGSFGKPGGPEPVYTDGYSVYGLELTPDEKQVTFMKYFPGENAKPTIMPAYVTKSGYTETINTRSKVGQIDGKSALGILDVTKDSVYELKIDQIPGITDFPDYIKDYPEKYKDRKAEVRPVSMMGPQWSPDGRFGIIEV